MRKTKGYRVVFFVDAPPKTRAHTKTITDDIVQEMEHAVRLYHEDAPLGVMSLSSVTPIEESR